MIAGHNQIEAAIERLVAELREGLKHGFFEYRLIGEIGRGASGN
jgi:hypothetical protein